MAWKWSTQIGEKLDVAACNRSCKLGFMCCRSCEVDRESLWAVASAEVEGLEHVYGYCAGVKLFHAVMLCENTLER